MDAIAAVERLGRANQGLVTAADLRAAGVGSRDLTRAGSGVVKVCRAVYATAALPPLPRFLVTEAGPAPAYVVHVRALLLSMGASTVARGRTAAVLRGWALLVEPGRTVEVGVTHGRSRVARRGVKVRQYRRLTCDVVAYPGAAPLKVTCAVQTAVDCCLGLPFLEAVVACDSAMRSRQVDLRQLRAAAASLPGVRDAARVRQVLDLCDPLSGSVLESVLRVAMVQRGILGFQTQYALRRVPMLRVDFAFVAEHLVVEVDGQKWHQDAARDRERDNTLARLGFRVLRYTWSDVLHERERVLSEICDALAAPSRLQLEPSHPSQTAAAA